MAGLCVVLAVLLSGCFGDGGRGPKEQVPEGVSSATHTVAAPLEMDHPPMRFGLDWTA